MTTTVRSYLGRAAADALAAKLRSVVSNEGGAGAVAYSQAQDYAAFDPNSIGAFLQDFLARLADASDPANGAAMLGLMRAATGAKSQTPYQWFSWKPMSVFEFMTDAEIEDVQSGAPVLDHTASWTLWSDAVQAAKNRRGVIPAGIYNIDNWDINHVGACFDGDGQSAITLTHGVKIKCRSAQTNFVLIANATGGHIGGVEVDGNGLATNVVRMSNALTDFTTNNVTYGGAVDGGVNLDLEPIAANTNVSELAFFDVRLAGCGSRGSGSGIQNLRINSDESLVISFYNLKSFGNTEDASDTPYGAVIVKGTCTFYTPFFTKIGTNDIKMGANAGSLSVVDGRSESDTADSILALGGAGDLTLVNYVHGTATNTTLTVGAGYTGRVTALGGQMNNVTNQSATADVVLFNTRIFDTGAIGGAYADRVVHFTKGMLKVNATCGVITTLAYGVTVTIDAAKSNKHYVLVTDASAFSMAAPSNPTAGQSIVLDIQNGNVGAMGAITWNAVFKLAGGFVNPSGAKRRKIAFTYDGSSWIEDWRSAADGAV